MIPFEIWHFVDSALPAGGYAFSQGLEAAYQKKILSEEKEFLNYLSSYLRQLSTSELPYLNSCHEIFTGKFPIHMEDLFQEYGATQTSSSLSKGNQILGRSWLRLMDHLYDNILIKDLKQKILTSPLPPFFTPIFGITLFAIELELKTVKELFLWLSLRDQINAAVRLGIIGSMRGNLIQKEFYSELPGYLEISESLNYQDAFKSAFVIDLCQASHHELYSKLFQN